VIMAVERAHKEIEYQERAITKGSQTREEDSFNKMIVMDNEREYIILCTKLQIVFIWQKKNIKMGDN